MSRLPDFLPIYNMYRLDESLLWDEKVPEIDTNGNNLALLALSTLEVLNVDDDFVSELKGAYSNANIETRSRQKFEKAPDGCLDIPIE